MFHFPLGPVRPFSRASLRDVRRRVLVSIGLAAVPVAVALPAQAWTPPPLLQQVSVDFDCSACQKEFRGFAVDANGNIFVTVDFFLIKFSPSGVLDWTHTSANSRLRRTCGVDVDGDGNVYLIDGYTHIIHKTDNDGVGLAEWQGDPEGYWLGAGFGLRLDQDGSVLVRTHSQTQRMAADGDREAQWYSGGEYAVALDASRNVYTADNGTIFKTTAGGVPLATFGPTPYPDAAFGHPSGIAVDENGFIYIIDGGPAVRVFGPEGQYRVSWVLNNNARLRDIRFVNGRLALLNGRSVDFYGHPGNFPPPPPPPPPSRETPSHIMLHIGSVVPRQEVCFDGPTSIGGIVTSADANQNGTADYYVYLLGSPHYAGTPEGLGGMQLGIDYTTGGPGRSAPLVVNDWVLCADLQFADDAWPASGTGNTLTWASCRMTPIVVAGAFSVSAYSASTMSIAPFPPTGLIKTANCNAVETLPDQTLGLDQVGWVSIRHGAIGLDIDGCNPAMEPCETRVTPTKRTTWGQIKTLYGAPAEVPAGH